MHPRQAIAFVQWKEGIDRVHQEARPRFLVARICYEVKRFRYNTLKHV